MTNMIPIGELAKIISGTGFPKVLQGNGHGDIPFAKVSDITIANQRGTTISRAANYLTEDEALKLRGKVFPAGSIAFAKIGEAIKHNRRVVTTREMLFDNNVMGIVPDTTKVFTKYFYYILQMFDFYKLAVTTAVPSIRKTDVELIEIPLPPLAEQKRIATILDKADAIRRKRQDAIDLADTFLRSVFLEMFGDPVRNPMEWDEAPLKDIAFIGSGVTKGKKYKDVELVEVPYMRVANVQDGWIDTSDMKTIFVSPTDVERYSMQKGDLLLTEGGDPDKLGRGAVWDGSVSPCIHQNHIFKVRFDTSVVIPEYASFLIGSIRGKKYFLRAAKQTTGIATINKTQLSNFQMLIPDIDRQKQFLNIVKNTAVTRNKLEQASLEANNLFSSLQLRAFRGDL